MVNYNCILKIIFVVTVMANILLIEDSPDAAEMLTLLLTMKSHKVETAASTLAAREKMANFPFGLIIIDVWLGRDNGKELCKQIRKTDKKIPILLMSANPNLLEDYTECGANAVIEKPFNIRIITDQINRLVP